MTIAESLLSLNTYPIPANTIEKYCIERGLVTTDDFTLVVSQSDAYRLATADVYLWLYTAPDLKEQQISFNVEERENFLEMANSIYDELIVMKGIFMNICYMMIRFGNTINLFRRRLSASLLQQRPISASRHLRSG